MSEAQNQNQPGTAEKGIVILMLLLSLGAFQNLLVTGPIEKQNMGMPGMQVVWSMFYLITLAMYFHSCAQPVRNIFTVLPLVTVLSFVFASISWSQDPGLTARRSIALALSLVFGVYFGSRFPAREQFRLLACAFAICIVFSFFFELLGLNPSEGIPGWYGVFFQKNILGKAMVLSALVFMFWKRVEPAQRWRANAGLIASALLVMLSRSMTAVVVFALLLVLIPYLRWTLPKALGWTVTGIALLLIAGTLSVLWAATHLEAITTVIGRSPMLTGRVPLWILSSVMALRRPWLGYGFNAFWLPDDAYVQKIWHLLRWEPPHAHNGFIELWLELGFVGTGLFLLVYANYSIKATKLLRQSSEADSAWPLIFLVFLFFTNFTETVFLSANSIYFILYTSIAITLCARASKKSNRSDFSEPIRSYA
jgi:exopolysaccharide production protein ExoQ